MFDLDREVARWRERQERTSSLAAAELDELEDHLRARVNLEMELMAVPSRRRAFALACEGLGEAAALSREFARAGTPRWREVMIAGWAMFGASFFLPVRVWSLHDVAQNSYEVSWDHVTDLSLLVLPTLFFLLTIPTLWNAGHARGRWLRGLLGVTGMAFLAFGVVYSVWGDAMWTALLGIDGLAGFNVVYASLGLGFWLWTSSFFVAAIALQLRAHHLRPVQPAELSSVSSEGASE